MIPYDGSMRKRGTQEGSVRFKDGKWYGSYSRYVSDLSGNIEYKRREVALDATTKRAAKAELRDKYVAPANAQAAMPEGTATLRQFVEARFKPDHMASLREGGKRHYGTQLKHLESIMDIRLLDISPMIAQRLLSAKAAAGLSAQSVRHIRNALSAILGYARDLQYIDGRLATEAVRIPSAPPKQRQALTIDQAQILIDSLPAKYRPVVRFMLATGARASEAAGIRWRDINITDSAAIVDGELRRPYTVHFRHAWKYGKYAELKSARSRRDVPMTSALWVELQTMHEQRADGDEVVFSAVRYGQAKPIDMHNFLNKVLKPLGVKLGMPWLNIHCLRHTTSTWLDAAGAPMGQKNLLMGHATNKTGMQYTHAEENSQRSAIETATDRLRVQ